MATDRLSRRLWPVHLVEREVQPLAVSVGWQLDVHDPTHYRGYRFRFHLYGYRSPITASMACTSGGKGSPTSRSIRGLAIGCSRSNALPGLSLSFSSVGTFITSVLPRTECRLFREWLKLWPIRIFWRSILREFSRHPSIWVLASGILCVSGAWQLARERNAPPGISE